MKKCLIATPSYDGNLSAYYVNSLIKTIELGHHNDIEFVYEFVIGDSLVQRARNTLFASAFRGEYDCILWIDADIEWHPVWAIDFCNSEKDVLSAAYPIKTDFKESYAIKFENIEDKPFVKVLGNGLGFTKMSRKAINYLWDSSEEYLDDGDTVRSVFEVTVKDNDIYSEDIIVCEKLINGGFDIFLDTDKTCNHIGSYKYRGNFREYVRSIQS